jgi:hypothetical protein
MKTALLAAAALLTLTIGSAHAAGTTDTMEPTQAPSVQDSYSPPNSWADFDLPGTGDSQNVTLHGPGESPEATSRWSDTPASRALLNLEEPTSNGS